MSLQNDIDPLKPAPIKIWNDLSISQKFELMKADEACKLFSANYQNANLVCIALNIAMIAAAVGIAIAKTTGTSTLVLHLVPLTAIAVLAAGTLALNCKFLNHWVQCAKKAHLKNYLEENWDKLVKQLPTFENIPDPDTHGPHLEQFKSELIEDMISTGTFVLDDKLVDHWNEYAKTELLKRDLHLNWDRLEENLRTFTHIPNIHTHLSYLDEKKSMIIEYMASAETVVHPQLRTLFETFLNQLKENHQTAFEAVSDVKDFVKRLLTKRPVCFFNAQDSYLLETDPTKVYESDTDKAFAKIGTPEEMKPITIADFITEIERVLSSMLSIGSYVTFLNNGHLGNNGKMDQDQAHTEKAYLMALVGPRFESSMEEKHKTSPALEFQQMVVTPHQNINEKYGPDGSLAKDAYWQALADFYAILHFPTFGEVQKNPDDYIAINSRAGESDSNEKIYINRKVYQKRMRMTLEPFFKQALKVADEQNKQVFIRVPGLGTGVWALDADKQATEIVTICNEIIGDLSSDERAKISGIQYAYFTAKLENNPKHHHGVKAMHDRCNIGDPLPNGYKNSFLVTGYAWDGFSDPGNELAAGQCGSLDPAVSAATLAYFIQNARYNPAVCMNQTWA